MLYGVADYAQMRRANAWFIDRTAKIRDLEATRWWNCTGWSSCSTAATAC